MAMTTGALALGGANLDNYNIHAEENARIEIVGTGYGASKTVVAARLANGTMAAPTHVNVGQIMGEFAIGGYKDSAFTTSASAYMLGTATSMIFPLSNRYSRETSFGLSKVWRYELELDWFLS